MPLLIDSKLIALGARRALSREAATDILRRENKARSTFDVFLSHSLQDAQLILGIKILLEQQGFTVYVDWVDDPQLSRDHVTPATADVLRQRMQTCKSLLYAATSNAGQSKWMPWELGYFDGLRRGLVAILPIAAQGGISTFQGQEYLGLYPQVEVGAFDRLQLRRGQRALPLREWMSPPTIPYPRY